MHKNITWSDSKVGARVSAKSDELEMFLNAMIEARDLGLNICNIRTDNNGGPIAEFTKQCKVEEFATMYRRASELGWS